MGRLAIIKSIENTKTTRRLVIEDKDWEKLEKLAQSLQRESGSYISVSSLIRSAIRRLLKDAGVE